MSTASRPEAFQSQVCDPPGASPRDAAAEPLVLGLPPLIAVGAFALELVGFVSGSSDSSRLAVLIASSASARCP
jgi:hypothetical protein